MAALSPHYDPISLEPALQAEWSLRDAHRALEHDPRFPKGKFYACSMLPYPSGRLHMGHVRNYTINDVMARALRMQGYNVLMPMGWDAFGLPAENAAMANNVAPAAWTEENIATMKRQMQAMGLAIDWSREIATCKPQYYRWNQWLFLKMREKGIAYVKTGSVNWDPIDQTVLANEQVIDGRGWRSGALVEKRDIPMYYLGITRHAKALIDGLEGLGWPDRVKLMQENWIGQSKGVRFAFPHTIRDASGALVQAGLTHVFTTRADTIMGISFMAVAPEHPLAGLAAQGNPDLAAFVERCQSGGVAEADLATRDKEGMDTGLTVSHPLTGEAVPVWVGNYVLMSYGDGAVMGVPAHDERDFAFAKKYGLPIRQVVQKPGQAFSDAAWQDWYADKQGVSCVASGPLNGLDQATAVETVAKLLAAKGLGQTKTTIRLRDWGISRQRYWGTPIPIIHCPSCGEVPVPEADLPVVLPDNLVPDGSGNPLQSCEAFLKVACPTCGADARRETDTMDTFIDSSWYHMRYCSPDAAEAMVDERVAYWMPMDQYIGGIEHAVLHLLYARFWTKVMHEIGLVSFDEPFSNLLTQGMVLNETYYREADNGRKTWFNPADVELQTDERGRPQAAVLRSDGQPVSIGGTEKMSKSKNNGIDPQALIDRYGADTARLFTMFASPPEQTLEWSDAGVEGAHRFLRRVWGFTQAHQAALSVVATPSTPAVRDAVRGDAAAEELRRQVHELLRQADFDLSRRQYNTVVSAAMKMLNVLEEAAKAQEQPGAPMKAALQEGMGVLLRVLYPIVPHLTTELWMALGHGPDRMSLLDAAWPQVDEAALLRDTVELMLQVNGKLRGSLWVPAQASEDDIIALATAQEAFLKFSDGKPLRRAIVVAGRLVNLVV
ncbi:MAG: leucine--tRNA ligase [Proteobacteria bacterium]|nr:leucine--tRNA ligase [Pseudomonadota bacterium]